MPAHKYDIRLRATIEIGGEYLGDTVEHALDTARLELRSAGEISNIDIERAVIIDDDMQTSE